MIVKQFSLRRCFSVALSYHQAGDQVISRMRIILLKNLKFEWLLKVTSITLIVSVRTCSEGDRVCLFERVFFITSLCQKIYAVQIVLKTKINSDQPSNISICILVLPNVSSVVSPIALLSFAKSWDVHSRRYPYIYTILNTECIYPVVCRKTSSLEIPIVLLQMQKKTPEKQSFRPFFPLHLSIGPKMGTTSDETFF